MESSVINIVLKVHPEGNVNVSWDPLRITNVKLMVALEETSEDHQSV